MNRFSSLKHVQHVDAYIDAPKATILDKIYETMSRNQVKLDRTRKL